MWIELGHFSLILALILSLMLGSIPFVGTQLNQRHWQCCAKPMALLLFALTLVSYATLTNAFVENDFSVLYVASTSHSSMPLIYRISGVWGSHEGSLLLWALILTTWTALISLFSKSIPTSLSARILATLGLISFGFIAFILFTSNPFIRLIPAALEGQNLNPLLQDPGLAVHPPMLYLGYVGFSVPFAFAIAVMLEGKLERSWLLWLRPWCAFAFAFLTIGIALGSLWAYYELGWGGWWFWDPVENASLMPWLIGAALIHSLAVSEKRETLKAWTILLSLLAFALSLLGTFLVRSGVLTSVHAFASDPQRGLFILLYLCLVVGISLSLYAIKAPLFKDDNRFAPLSRETTLLLNNILLCIAAATVLLGTLYPLALEALNLGKISVGAPYFNSIMVPLALGLGGIISLGIFLRWKNDDLKRIRTILLITLSLGVISAITYSIYSKQPFQFIGITALSIAFWIIVSNTYWLIQQKSNISVMGAVFAHIGFAISIIGITMTSLYSSEQDMRLALGDSVNIDKFTLHFEELSHEVSEQYQSTTATFSIKILGSEIAKVYPEKRIYPVQTMPMTEAGIDGSWRRDIFIALAEPLSNDEWAVRIYHKPYIRLIWYGGIIIAIGAALAVFDRRYLRIRRRHSVGAHSTP